MVFHRYSSFVYWGFLQEKITATLYVDEADGKEYRWQYPFALNVFMAISTCLIASTGDTFSGARNIPFIAFAKPAITCAIGNV